MYGIKEKGIMGQYDNMKKGATHTFSWLDCICDFWEKVRNLVRWEDPAATWIYLGTLVIVFLVVTFLPLRQIIHIALVYKFVNKKKWQGKRVENNEEVCRIELANFLKEKQLDRWVNQYDEKWEVSLTRRMTKKQFEHNLTLYFQNVVRIYLPRKLLDLCETPNQFIEYIG